MVSFANQAKRSRVNYEENLADAYTNNPNVSPGGGSVAQRRKLTPSLQTDKTGAWDQHMEQLNQNLKDVIAAAVDDEFPSPVLEYIRIREMMDALYQPPIGEVLTCGSDEVGALAVTKDADEDKLDDYPPTRTLLPEGTPDVCGVFAGGMHSGVVTVDGRCLTFGQNDDCALGRPVSEENMHLAGEVVLPPEARGRVIHAEGGDNFSIFLTMEGKVYQCGTMKDVDSGKFTPVLPGQSLKKDMRQETPIEVIYPERIVKISAGDNAVAALGASGTLYTHGMGHMGELGRSKSMHAPTKKVNTNPSKPEDGEYYLTYDLGKTFIGKTVKETETVEKDGKLVQQTYDKYIYNTELIEKRFMIPQQVEYENGNSYTVLDMAMGQTHLVVIARDAAGEIRVFATGNNQYGQLGVGDQKQRHALAEIAIFNGLDTIRQVSVGGFHTIFLNAMGTAVYACGRSDYGQLGLPSTEKEEAGSFVTVPTQISFPHETKNHCIDRIIAGANHSMAIFDNGDLYTWGNNISAQTGHQYNEELNGLDDIVLPQRLNLMRKYKNTQAVALAASCGAQHSIFLAKPYKLAKPCK